MGVMEVGCFRDETARRLNAAEKEIRELRRNEMTMLLRVMALEKLAGATPAEVALATATPVVRTHRFPFIADTEEDGNGT